MQMDINLQTLNNHFICSILQTYETLNLQYHFKTQRQIHERPVATLKTLDPTPAVHSRGEDSDVLGYCAK